MGIDPNVLLVTGLAKSTITYTKSYSISTKSVEYLENENGERSFIIIGSSDRNVADRIYGQSFTRGDGHVEANFFNSKGIETGRAKSGSIYNNKAWKISMVGIKNLPDDTMTVKLIARGDNSGASNMLTIAKTILKKESQNQKNQDITFNEQTNSGDFNETPITEINLNGGCSECTGTELSSMMILKEGYHRMPDGSMMKDSDMEKGNNMKIAGIMAAGFIGLLLYTKGGLK